jgi:dipeptidyl aminopeptidase/acylaminoacyl peptidase
MGSIPVRTFAALTAILLGPSFSSIQAQTSLQYQKPPRAIIDLVDTRPTPRVEVSPQDSTGSRWLLIESFSGLPTIADLAQPELRLAGLRFNPRTNGPSRGRYITSLMLQALPNGDAKPISGMPPDAKIRFPAWSPDARHVSFVNASDNPSDAGLSLWIVDVASAQAHRVPGVTLNGVFSSPCGWSSDNASLICKTVPQARGSAPKRSEIPTGPVVQENLGRITPGATFQDLLKNPEDERIFDYYATSQIQIVHLDGTVKPIGEPGVIESASPSPDAQYVLIDQRHHPYSYLLPFGMFPERVLAINVATGSSKQLADKPLEDTIPNIHDAVEAGRREFDWRSDAPATVAWVEAADGGDPRQDVPIRDTVFLLDAPFDAVPHKLAELPVRFLSLAWGNAHLALIQELRWKDRKRIILAVSPDAPATPVKLFEGSFEDRYHDPGEPFLVLNTSGRLVLQTTSDSHGIYFHADGASPEGDRPFVSLISAANGESKHIWQSADKFFESPVSVLDPAAPAILLSRESPDLPPNYYRKSLAKDDFKQVTFFPSPYGNSPLPKKRVLKYKRADGVDLSANLYLPPGYKPDDGPLPTLIEAYPTEYKTRSAAGQMNGSPFEFTFLYWGSPIPFTTQGFAVLESATIPIIGEGQSEPNDTYVEQLVASAKAAIDGRTPRRGRSPSCRCHGTLLRRLHDREPACPQRALQSRHRPQRSLQPHPHSLRIPERGANLLAGARDLLQDVPIFLRR